MNMASDSTLTYCEVSYHSEYHFPIRINPYNVWNDTAMALKSNSQVN